MYNPFIKRMVYKIASNFIDLYIVFYDFTSTFDYLSNEIT
jgi:hypothetical protein